MDMNRNIMFLDAETTELKRGSADYWIIYVCEGEAEFTAGTRMCCAASGQVTVITLSNQDVQIRPNLDFRGYMLRVCDLSSAELVRRYLPLMNAPNETMNVVTAGKQQKSIAAVFRNMQAADSGDEKEMLSLLEELMIRLYRASPKSFAGTNANRTEIVSNIRDRLEKEYSKDFCLIDIAADYNMSVSYLAHLFKDVTGISLMRYLLNCRVFAAREYLAHTIVPIKEVAQKCGFHDASNFGRTFKKETGCTPRQYRRQHSAVKTGTEALFDEE